MDTRCLGPVLLLTILVAASCERRAQTPPPATGGGPSPESSSVERRMAEHFVATSVMREALVHGDLDGFARAAAIIATESDSTTPSTKVRDAASRAREAKTLDAAANALGELGLACASCHREHGGPKAVPGEAPEAKKGIEAQMARHRWAAEVMWQGLISPSDEAWSKGTEVFATAPLVTSAVDPKAETAAQLSVLGVATRAHFLGEAAREAYTPEARAKALGEIYATCAECHRVAAAP